MISPAVVLLSGGIDSTVALAIARAEGFEPHSLSFNYGQRHEAELDTAGRIARAQGTYLAVAVPAVLFGTSALINPELDLPRQPAAEVDATYVPARNTVFLSMALALAETIGARDIFIGVNADDYAGYPDCRPEYLNAFQRMAALATASGPVEIHAPLVTMTKAEIIARGLDLGVDFSLTRSCYSADPSPCGACGACVLRASAFAEVGIPDPALAGDRR